MRVPSGHAADGDAMARSGRVSATEQQQRQDAEKQTRGTPMLPPLPLAWSRDGRLAITAKG
jgi:hypothetical protein